MVALATAAAFATHGLWRVAALAIVLALAPSSLAALREHLGPQRWLAVARAAPIALLVAVAGGMLWPLVTGEPPASRDHAIHYFQARILVDEMLPSGRLSGWTERFNHGFPFGEGYPTLGVLWASASHLLTLGALDLRESYAWGLLGVWSLTLWGSWRVAAAIATDVRTRQGDADARDDDLVSRWAGSAGAFAWLLDPGAARQGGWNYLMFHGVWPQQLSSALWIAGLVWTLRALHDRRPRAIAMAAVCLAASVLAHPFGLLTAVASAVGLVVVARLADDARRWAPGSLRVLALIHGLAAALAAAGVATFFAASAELGRSPVAWSELGELAARLTTGDLLAGTWAWTGGLAVVGLGLALWSGRASAWLAAGLCCGLLFLGSRDAITLLELDLVAAGFKNLQFPRFAIALKPLAFAMAGAALVVAIRAVAAALGRGAVVDARRRWFVAIVLAPAFTALLGRTDLFAPRPVGSIDTLRRSELAVEERELRAALVAEAEHTAAMRVAFLRAEMGGGTYPMFAIADAGAAAVLDGHVATVNFEHIVERRGVAVFERLGVTHVIHDRPLGEGDAELAAVLEPVGVFGPYTLARFVAAPDTGPRFVRGEGTASAVEHGPERRVFEVETSGGTLQIAQAPSSRWAWTLDGAPIEASTSTVHGDMDVVGLELPHGGRVVATYVTTDAERWGRWLSLAGLVVVAGLVLRGRPLALRSRSFGSGRAVAIALGVGAVGMGVLVVRRQHTQLDRTWHEYADTRFFARTGAPEFVDDLTITREIAIDRAARPVCDGLLGKDALVECEEGDYRPNPSFVYIDPYLYRCVSFGIAAGDTATIRLGEPGDHVVGFAMRRGSDGKGRHLRFGTGRALQVLGNRRADLHFGAEEEPVVTIENAGDDPELVCVGGARFE